MCKNEAKRTDKRDVSEQCKRNRWGRCIRTLQKEQMREMCQNYAKKEQMREMCQNCAKARDEKDMSDLCKRNR